MDRVIPDILQHIFTYLTIGNISKLSRVNVRFNLVINRELMWKDMISAIYGVNKMYGSSWKETAKNLFICNMIDLNKRWINGMTYREIFDSAVSKCGNGRKYVKDMRYKAICKVYNFTYNGGEKISFIYDEQSLQNYAWENMNDIESKFQRKELDYFEKVMTREIAVIIASVYIFDDMNPISPLPLHILLEFTYGNRPEIPKNVKSSSLFDYIPYVILFSSFTHEQLWTLFDAD